MIPHFCDVIMVKVSGPNGAIAELNAMILRIDGYCVLIFYIASVIVVSEF